MFTFIRMKVYRRKFAIYLLVLFLLCVLAGVLLCLGITQNRIGAGRNDALRAFERVENSLSAYVEEIERYVLHVYSDRELLSDMLLFMDSDAEAYLSERLNNPATDRPNIVDDIREFAAIGGRRLFRYISLHGARNTNVVHFDEGGSTVAFGVPGTSPLFDEAIAEGILYTRTLVSPAQVSEQIGRMCFLLDTQAVFSVAHEYALPSAAALDFSGGCVVVAGSADHAALYLAISETGRNQGTVRDGLNARYYVSYTSGRFGYQFIASQDLFSIIRSNSILYLLAISAASIIFVCVSLLVIANMRQDARFLTQIVDTIKRAKQGDFSAQAAPAPRRNEYGMIAEELSEMTSMLDAYIRREYVLRLKQQETEMLALQEQINPHFLYNTLEIIRGRASAREDHGIADAVSSLGRLYRLMVKSDSIITMAEEAELLSAYLSIMELRYEGRFVYQISLEEAVQPLKTVKFWMQPVAENFFRHGFDLQSETNLLLVSGYAREDAYVVELMNNGAKLPPDQLALMNEALKAGELGNSNRIGLRNVCARLRYYYGNGLHMQVENNEEAGVTIRVTIAKGGDAQCIH